MLNHDQYQNRTTIQDFCHTREVPVVVVSELWNKGGWQSIGHQYGNMDTHSYLTAIDADGKIIAKNIAETFDAGWCCNKAHGISRDIESVAELPDNWAEIYISYYVNYGKSCDQLVARNNQDGTAQLFRAYLRYWGR